MILIDNKIINCDVSSKKKQVSDFVLIKKKKGIRNYIISLFPNTACIIVYNIHIYLFAHLCIRYVYDDIFVYTVGRSLVFLMSLEYAPAHIRYYIDLLHVGFYNVTFV